MVFSIPIFAHVCSAILYASGIAPDLQLRIVEATFIYPGSEQ
jgi:hypothetical protein